MTEHAAPLAEARLPGWMTGAGIGIAHRLIATAVALVFAAGLWIPNLHRCFRVRVDDYYTGPEGGLPPVTRAIAAHHLHLWTDPDLRRGEIERMRGSNAEWDFMGRTFLALALANLAVREPATAPIYLEIVDRIIEETVTLEAKHGQKFFLMPYAAWKPFIASSGRSLFVDGEIALMMAARRLASESARWRAPLRERLALVAEQMEAGPVLSAESYPDECWTFCNCIAAAALHIAALLDGDRHHALPTRWLAMARQRLCDGHTGMLISSFELNGSPLDGPEGTTIWLAAHCLDLIDPAWAADQYRRARQELGCDFFGFGYAREWPRSWVGATDVDSGPIIPGLELSAGSTGLAFLGAATFADREFLGRLLTNLEYGAMPIVEPDGRRRYLASNQVGDAVLLYALTQGPLWRRAHALAATGALPPATGDDEAPR